MSAGQELLPRRSLSERFAPLVSARVPLFGLSGLCPRGRDRRSANVAANAAANLPKDASPITSNWGRAGHKNPDANTRFWLNLTIFRMNTCTKKVGGGGCRILAATSTLFGFGCRTLRFQGCGFSMPRPRRRAIAPPARLRYSAAQGWVRTSREAAVPCAHL